ncbi:DUF1700 domain-containing protein [archaeon]|jgi:uncharacterized membrane protein|nr:DUF1700 domain-containing protein [archaeon]MBT4351579.1 DUF1700 domain-containing protein [archaeon]MBT4648603.1 DUF1700 domain-containing protein [archaeon]MBT6821432.1 DUF1700 domain-containing protein [archaeon]MBT7393027.1 DUF1700 domain-containing protein [archaeon]
MNKKEFFKELNEYLIGINKKEKKDILQDYEEHFKIGKKKKRTESQIVKSLGEPKQIAREIRAESANSEKTEIKSEAIETFVAAKKLSIHLFNEAKNKVDNLLQEKKDSNASTIIVGALVIAAIIILLKNTFLFFLVIVIFGFYMFSKDSKEKNISIKDNKSKKVTNEIKENSFPRLLISITFNLLFFIWFWISIFAVVLSFFIVSFSILLSSALIIAFMVFALIKHSSYIINDILYSGLFSGIGLVILSGLMMNLSNWCLKYFFIITKKYIELNSRFVRK